jgi:hypothetical protein
MDAHRSLPTAAALTFALLLSVPAFAQVNGAIYTTVADGSTVNTNIYADKAEVYLNGGPQNQSNPGLTPDGLYYFQVTDPSGAVLLSTDHVECRAVVVYDGRIIGVPNVEPPAACTTGYHAVGALNANNGQRPVQLLPFNDTPNHGGEYKAWLTPVHQYAANGDCGRTNSRASFGFCDSDSKTDNFKIRNSEAAYVSVCKFNDLNNNGLQEPDEPLLPHWPISFASAGDATIQTQTSDGGCVVVAFTQFSNGGGKTVTVTENTQAPAWLQTAPADGGAYGDGVTVAGGVITVVIKAGDEVVLPYFGNVEQSTLLQPLVVTLDASPSLTRTFAWGISKDVDRTRANTASSSATFAYTVKVTHDAGTDSAWTVSGKIVVSNPNDTAVSGVDVLQTVDNGGTCVVTGGDDIVVPAESHVDVPYSCTYPGLPLPGTSSATASWNDSSATGSTAVDFVNATVAGIDDSAIVTDSLAGQLGVVSASQPSPALFEYSLTFDNQPAGTCTTHGNTASFTANSTEATGSASQSVQVCVGADLVVTKTAATAFSSGIDKTSDRTVVQQRGGTVAFTYTVLVTQSGWSVAGDMTVTNPNDWQDITANLADALSLSGGACAINGGSPVVSVARNSSVTLPYLCVFGSAPAAADGVNTATATWDAAGSFTPSGEASGSAGFAFGPLTVVDTFNGVTLTLGTIAAPAALTTFTDARAVANAAPGTCASYANLAVITQTGQAATKTVTVCNTATGAHTIGFWQNKNGQAIISGSAATTGVCNLTAYLRQFAPFQDLSATATCSKVAAYATSIIKAANASGAAMNAMLKAQMLATALSVYFSSPTLGGNLIGAGASVGDVLFNVTQASAAMGGDTQLTAAQMLIYAASQSNIGGTLWYENVKIIQELAKTAFDAINNQVAPIGF